jgi:hypothetical protein
MKFGEGLSSSLPPIVIPATETSREGLKELCELLEEVVVYATTTEQFALATRAKRWVGRIKKILEGDGVIDPTR